LKKKELNLAIKEGEEDNIYEDIFKIMNKEIVEMEEKYGFSEESDSDHEKQHV